MKGEIIEPKRLPAKDPASREKQLINLAVDLAEKQLIDGTAAASTINHYLKLASRREAIEREILEKQAELLQAKTSALESNKNTELLYQNAIEAMKRYGSS